VWFEKALTGTFQEAQTGVVDIQNFAPEAVDWLVHYIYTGSMSSRRRTGLGNMLTSAVCNIPALKPGTPAKTNFVTCYEVYTVADYFALSPLAKIALDALTAEFDSKLGPIQLQYESSSDWLPELCEAIRLVYADVPLNDTTHLSPIRAAFLNFVHTARFYFLQNPDFNKFLDEEAPVFALDLFRAMRNTGDFFAYLPDPHCSYCKMKPTRGDKAYYTHLAPETLKLTASCSTCAGKKDFGSGMANWAGKKNPGGT
jgi:hypothetical protein